jgi:hypothetical protein
VINEPLKSLEARWLNTWDKNPNRWDVLDDLEEKITTITGETAGQISHRLYEVIEAREKGERP